MADKSAIEWTEATWNPVTGCTEVSPGCARYYAKTFAERFRWVKGHPYEVGFDLTLRPGRLTQPLEWRAPRLIFVNSMSDLFHEDVPLEFIAQVFEVMEPTASIWRPCWATRARRRRHHERDVLRQSPALSRQGRTAEVRGAHFPTHGRQAAARCRRVDRGGQPLPRPQLAGGDEHVPAAAGGRGGQRLGICDRLRLGLAGARPTRESSRNYSRAPFNLLELCIGGQ